MTSDTPVSDGLAHGSRHETIGRVVPLPGKIAFLSGGGEMGQRIREFDWSKTPLGPAEGWPNSLKLAVSIMLTSRQAFWIGWGPELTYLYNDPYKSIIGGKHPTALGQPTDVVWRELRGVIGPLLKGVIERGEGSYSEEQRLYMERHGYPEETYYTFSYSPLPDDEGGIGGVICANSEATQSVVQERQLALLKDLATRTADCRTRQDGLRAIAETLSDHSADLPFALIYARTPDGRFELAETVKVGRDHPAVGFDWPIEQALASKEIVRVDAPPLPTLPRLPEGTLEPLDQAAILPIVPAGQSGFAGALVVRLNPFRRYDEKYANFLGLVAGQVAASVASAQAYEEEARRAESLAELDRAKTRFFSNVSHEFRTPLTLMLGPVQDLLQGTVPVSREARDRLELVHRNSLRLLKLVNAMLDFSRIEGGRVQPQLEPVDLSAYTAELANVFKDAMERAGLSLVIDCAAPQEPAYIDRDMWEKIVLNLLSNAFKFTLKGEIRVELSQVDDQLQLVVADTGLGIDPREVGKVFDRFHRAKESRGRTHEGTGIGLALVQELVRLHGGEIRVESELDRGSRFIVTIPFVRKRAAPEPTRAPFSERSSAAVAFAQEALRWLPKADSRSGLIDDGEGDDGISAGDAPGKKPRVLWADDNPDMSEYVARLLSGRFEVTSVSDGLAALEAARADPPDIVLSDVMMPRLDGFGLLRALRKDPALSAIPIILLSARAGENERVVGVESGADEYLVKPFSGRELVARLDAHVKLSRLRRQAETSLRAELDERERARIAVADSEERYRSIVSVITDVPWTADADGRFSEAQPAWEAYTGQTVEAYMGMGWTEALHPDDRDALVAAWAQIQKKPMRVEAEGRLWHARSGTWRHFVVQATPLLAQDGSVRHWVGSFTDVEERIRGEQQLRQARDEALAANRAKDEFLATLSHELRTPLNPVLLVSSEAASNETLPPAVREDFKLIADNVSLQARLIDDLLDFNRIVRGKVVLDRQLTDLHEVLRESVKTMRDDLSERRCAVHYRLQAPNPMVVGDPVRLRQVFWNLLKNALKFSPAGSPIEIATSGPDAGGRIEVRVSDRGIGMTPGELSRIFQPFVQGRHAKGAGTASLGGLGLGLAICRMLVEAHGGTVAAESAGLDQGSTFRILIPVEGTPADLAPEKGTAGGEGGPAAAPQPCRVLFVEDHASTRTVMTGILERRGYAVTPAESVAEALAKAQAQEFDVLVSDLGLPDGDGCQLMQRLRELKPGLVGIAVSGFGMEGDVERTRVAGFQEHLTKPLSIDLLERAIRRLADR